MLKESPKRKHNRDDPRFLTSVARGMAVMDCLAGAVGPKSLTELAHQTGLTVPTLQRLTATLLEAGYVVKEQHSKRYRLTVRALDLLYYFLSRNAFAKSAWPHVVRLRDRVQLDVSLSLPLEQTMIFLHRLPGYRGGFESTLPGRRSPMHATASGICFLAELENDQLDGYFDTADIDTAEEREKVNAAIARCREQGYGLSVDTGPLAQITLACPVVHKGGIIAGVSVHAPIAVCSVDELAERALSAVSTSAVALSA